MGWNFPLDQTILLRKTNANEMPFFFNCTLCLVLRRWVQPGGIIIGQLLTTSSTNNDPLSNSNSTQCLQSVACHLEGEAFPFSSFVYLSKVMVRVSSKERVAVGSVGQAELLIDWVPSSAKHKPLCVLTGLWQPVDKCSFLIFLLTLLSATFSMLSPR